MIFICGHCRSRLSIEDEHAQEEIVCSYCQETIIVPCTSPKKEISGWTWLIGIILLFFLFSSLGGVIFDPQSQHEEAVGRLPYIIIIFTIYLIFIYCYKNDFLREAKTKKCLSGEKCWFCTKNDLSSPSFYKKILMRTLVDSSIDGSVFSGSRTITETYISGDFEIPRCKECYRWDTFFICTFILGILLCIIIIPALIAFIALLFRNIKFRYLSHHEHPRYLLLKEQGYEEDNNISRILKWG